MVLIGAASHKSLVHDVYAKLVPRQTIQKSLTIWTVFLEPLKLPTCQLAAWCLHWNKSHCMTCSRNCFFSASPTLELGNVLLNSASLIHCFDLICVDTICRSGWAQFSNSLRTASPPMLFMMAWVACGPYCSRVLCNASCVSA